LIPPTAGALLQEVIDVAVILNALRAAPPLALPAPGLSRSVCTLDGDAIR
jgi:hypothetical protein